MEPNSLSVIDVKYRLSVCLSVKKVLFRFAPPDDDFGSVLINEEKNEKGAVASQYSRKKIVFPNRARQLRTLSPPTKSTFSVSS